MSPRNTVRGVDLFFFLWFLLCALQYADEAGRQSERTAGFVPSQSLPFFCFFLSHFSISYLFLSFFLSLHPSMHPASFSSFALIVINQGLFSNEGRRAIDGDEWARAARLTGQIPNTSGGLSSNPSNFV